MDGKRKCDMDIHNRIVFSLKKEVSSGLGYNRNMNHEGLVLNERSQSKRTNTGCFYLYEVPRVVKFTETESRREVARGWGEGEREG